MAGHLLPGGEGRFGAVSPPLSIGRRETGVLPNALWGEGWGEDWPGRWEIIVL
jgi:hypothetical protein